MNRRFSNRGRAVVTRGAVIYDTGMIEHGIEKAAGDVTDAAIFGGRQMVNMFTSGGRPIMARCTVIHDTGMIKHCGGKCRGTMAVRTILGCGYMCRGLTQGD